MSSDAFQQLQQELREFARERDWEQFHTPKNLAMALAGEVGELVELYQWLSPEEAARLSTEEGAEQLADELADVAIYLLRLADVAGVDLEHAIAAKIARNERRFPADHVRGRADLPPLEA